MTLPGDMDCDELVELITDYLEGKLAAFERIRFEEHLAICPSCVEYLSQMKQTVKVLSSLRDAPPSREELAPLMAAFRGWKQQR